MKDDRFIEAVERIYGKDQRYAPDSYEFVSDAVSYTVKKLERAKKPRGERHVKGAELVKGVAEYAVEQFGPLAKSVLADWGLTSGDAIGDVVYNLIRENLLYASDDDRREDFNGTDEALSETLAAASAPVEIHESAKKSKVPIIE